MDTQSQLNEEELTPVPVEAVFTPETQLNVRVDQLDQEPSSPRHPEEVPPQS